MFSKNHVVLTNCLNLFRSCHCGWVCTGNFSTGPQQLFKRAHNSKGGSPTVLLSRSTVSSSLYFSERKQRNGECLIRLATIVIGRDHNVVRLT